jgi:hypothetical protein
MTMALLVISINDPGLEKKSAEVAYARYALGIAEKEFGRGNGTVGSGSIIGMNAAGVANATLGTWTYTTSATKP